MAEEKEVKGACPPTTTDRPAANPSILAFGGLPKPSARQLARAQGKPPGAANDNDPGDGSQVGKRPFLNGAWLI
jgi:hypothetical protein